MRVATSRTAENSVFLGEVAELAGVAGSAVPRHTESPASIDGADLYARAAIGEFAAGVPREWAEGFTRLRAMRRPPNIPQARWQRLIDDAGRFMDHWAPKAAALGWDTASVFGCYQTSPDARLDAAGLVWLIGGHDIVAIGPDAATLRTATGATQTYRRRPFHEPGRVAAWELEVEP